MKIKAQIAMVMNLDKCIGCHTCSVTCKNVWTNRPGAEYMWWNNVETKPGIGYPKVWEDQEKWRGGWELKNGRPHLRSGGGFQKLVELFFSPRQPTIDDYYNPFAYDYETLTSRDKGKHPPVAKPKSAITGDDMAITWGPNWEDDLAGVHLTGPRDPNVVKMEEAIKFEFEQAFMMHLPRICEHCLNPSCVASCPSGAIYKRDEDGIVLVDQETCRGWRQCITGCPYKKIYFNWTTSKAEKCTLCYPRLEAGLPTICSETCVGRIRYLGLVLYDADRVAEAASVAREKELLSAQLGLLVDPSDPEVIRQARLDGIPEDWIESAQRSPVHKMIVRWGIALPLHPEYRTLPMVWYIPPLSPLAHFGDDIFPAIDQMRIPVEYLANMLTAGDTQAVRGALKKLAALRVYMRSLHVGQAPLEAVLAAARLTADETHEMYRLLAIAKYEDRFVIPPTHRENTDDLLAEQGACGFEFHQKARR